MLSKMALVVCLAYVSYGAPLRASLDAAVLPPLLHISAHVDVPGLSRRHGKHSPHHHPQKHPHQKGSQLESAIKKPLKQILGARGNVGSSASSGQRLSARDVDSTGEAGYIEVANVLGHTSLARTVAGLVLSASPGNGNAFDVGTSSTQASQFWMSPAPTADGGPANDTIVQLHIPIFNSASLTKEDYCATFATSPPSQLHLSPCGSAPGLSQLWAKSEDNKLSPLLRAAAPETAGMAAKFAAQPLPHDLLIAQFDAQPGQLSMSSTPTPPSSASATSSSAAGQLQSVLASGDGASASVSASAAQPTATGSSSGGALALFFVPQRQLDDSSDAPSSAAVSVGASTSSSSTASASLGASTSSSVARPTEAAILLAVSHAPISSVSALSSASSAAPSASSAASSLSPTRSIEELAAVISSAPASSQRSSVTPSMDAANMCTTTVTCSRPTGGALA